MSEGRFQYIVVATNSATGERVSAGAVSRTTLNGLIRDLQAAGLTQFQVTETVREIVTPGWDALSPS